MVSLLWNQREARLRAGWRVALFLLATGVASTALSGPGRRLLGGLLPVVYANVVEVGVLVLLVAVLLWLAARWLDHRPIADYGFHLSRAWWLDLGFGLALGAALLTGVYALALAMGWLTVTDTLVGPPGQPFVAAILADILVVAGIACWEQTVYRGYLIKNLAEGLTGRVLGARLAAVIAVLLPAVVFGLGHASNPGATTVSTVNTMVFGVLFGVAYVLTGELALALGLHFAWDFGQGFGFGRSGDAASLGAFLVTGEGDPSARLWTGWPYGVEGGLLGTVAFVVGFVLIAVWVRFRRGTVRLPSSLAQPPIHAPGRATVPARHR